MTRGRNGWRKKQNGNEACYTQGTREYYLLVLRRRMLAFLCHDSLGWRIQSGADVPFLLIVSPLAFETVHV